MDFWVNHICAECWDRFPPNHSHNECQRRTVIFFVPDTFKQAQTRWILCAHIIAHATWNRPERKLRYKWDPEGGSKTRALSEIGTALMDDADALAADLKEAPTRICVEMVGSSVFEVFTRPDMPGFAFVGFQVKPIAPLVSALRMDENGVHLGPYTLPDTKQRLI